MIWDSRKRRLSMVTLGILLGALGLIYFGAPVGIQADVATLPAPAAAGVDAEASAEVVSETLIKSTKTWDGNLLPDYPEEQPEITVLRITIPAGVELPVHKHPFINVGVLLEGALTVYTEENEVLHLEAGDPIIELVDKWHFGVNHGDEDAVIVVVYVGVVGEPITVPKENEESGY